MSDDGQGDVYIPMPPRTVIGLDAAALRGAVEYWLNARVLRAPVTVHRIEVARPAGSYGDQSPFEPEAVSVQVGPEGHQAVVPETGGGT